MDFVLQSFNDSTVKTYLRKGAGWALGTCWPAGWRVETGSRCTVVGGVRVFHTKYYQASVPPSAWSTHTVSTPAPAHTGFTFYSHNAVWGFGFMFLFSFPPLCMQLKSCKIETVCLSSVLHVPALAAWRSHIFPCWCLRLWTTPDWARSQGHMGNFWKSENKWSLVTG